MDKVLEVLQEWSTTYGIRVIGAVLILLIGRFVAQLLKQVVEKLMVKAKTEPTLVSFVGRFTHVLLLVFVVLAALSTLQVEITPFIAVLGAAGLAVGFALQGSLANFAAGVLLIIFRPFKVDDFIEAAGVTGTVEEIAIFTSRLKTPDNRSVIIPNAKLTGDNITNYTAKGTRRVDMVMGVSYGDDIDKVRAILMDILDNDQRVLKDPAPKVAVVQFADSSVNFVVRPWVNAENYWDVLFDTHETAKKRFDAEGVTIPFPQRDVHLFKHDEQ